MSIKNVDSRFKFLTSRQQEIVKIARKKGYVLLGEIKMFYSSKERWMDALEKLIAFNILIPDKQAKSNGKNNSVIFKRFLYIEREGENVQKTLEGL